MKLKGVIFDFNGVLLWDSALQVQAWQTVARNLRGQALSEDECREHMHGRPNSYVLSYLAGRTIEGRELQDLIQAKESHYRRLCLENPATFVLSPGTRDLLDILLEWSVPRTIATSSEKSNLDFFVEHLSLERWLDISRIVYDDGSRPGKPAPDVYLQAAENLYLPPQDCAVVEDSVSRILSARAAGVGYIIGIGPAAEHPRLLASGGVQAVIENLEHFPRELFH